MNLASNNQQIAFRQSRLYNTLRLIGMADSDIELFESLFVILVQKEVETWIQDALTPGEMIALENESQKQNLTFAQTMLAIDKAFEVKTGEQMEAKIIRYMDTYADIITDTKQQIIDLT